MGKDYKRLKTEEIENNRWRVWIYRALLLLMLFVYVKYKVIERIGFIPGILLIIVLVIVISNLLTLIFKIILKEKK
ncbi:hypothetical protein [Sporosarcina sp. SAFN-010]|uniref:hypothetical protein n=1 Tax=Sporosarcina sp. SAFN-010 TaxID=3387273 RepID=UPI003F7FCD15